MKTCCSLLFASHTARTWTTSAFAGAAAAIFLLAFPFSAHFSSFWLGLINRLSCYRCSRLVPGWWCKEKREKGKRGQADPRLNTDHTWCASTRFIFSSCTINKRERLVRESVYWQSSSSSCHHVVATATTAWNNS